MLLNIFIIYSNLGNRTSKFPELAANKLFVIVSSLGELLILFTNLMFEIILFNLVNLESTFPLNLAKKVESVYLVPLKLKASSINSKLTRGLNKPLCSVEPFS